MTVTALPQELPTALQPGSSLGSYLIERSLRMAPGGMVYAAVDAAGVRVLLRVLESAWTATEEGRERIGCDLLALQALEHPCVARVHDIGAEGGRTYYALEDRGRTTLADLVRRGRPLQQAELVWLGRELAAGLAALHEVDLVHGGLGAQSVVIGRERPAIVDLDWTTRATASTPDAEPKPEDDVAALGRVLVFAALGGPAERTLREQAPWLRARVSGLIDALGAPPGRRPDAPKVARLFAQIARDLGLEEAQPPATLLELVARGATSPGPPRGEEDEGPCLGRFGRYLLLSEVARGGMGVVYRARHADFPRVFALKVMLEGALADDSARRRFLREAEAAAALDHPAIVRVHDCGEVDGRAYIAMDFAEGCSLSDVCRSPDVRLDELLRIVLQVLRAVHYAHSRGIVHRDLKPENVIVDLQGNPHILDFGVAKRLGDEPGLITLAGELVGTPAYMPPEQAEARNDDIDTRSDVYSLGATLFEVVTRGRLPFEGKTISDTLTRILLEDAAPPSRLRDEVPWEVDAIVLKALEKRRERRYQSAAEMAEDLERFLEGLPIRARQAGLPYRAGRWVRRRWRAVAAVLAVSSALGLSSGVVAMRRAADEARRVSAHLAQGEAHLAGGRLDEARVAFEKALAFDDDERAPLAHAGLLRAERGLAEREAEARVRSQEERDRALASQHERDGVAHLESGNYHAAQASFIRAIAFGAPRGEELLHRAEEGLLLERMRQIQQEVARRDGDEADRLVKEARGALERDAVYDARTTFLQALAFDGKNEAALEGLVEADRRLRASDARKDEKARDARSQELLARAREAHARGRLLYREGGDVDVVRAAYLDALEAYDRALFLMPNREEARVEKVRVAREVSMVLRDEGQYELAEFVLRFGGVSLDTVVGPADLPADPHLVVIEADRVNVRRAFGGVVRFQQTHAFDRLREVVRARGDRWRVVVQVRSEATASLPPTVVCKGLWVQVEDRAFNTFSPTIRMAFDGGPYVRQVTVDARGRIVAAFERSYGLRTAEHVLAVEQAVLKVIESAAPPPTRTASKQP